MVMSSAYVVTWMSALYVRLFVVRNSADHDDLSNGKHYTRHLPTAIQAGSLVDHCSRAVTVHDDDGQAGAQSMVTDGHRELVAVGEPCAEPVQKSERTTVTRREGVPSCSTDDGAYVFRLHVCSDVEDELIDELMIGDPRHPSPLCPLCLMHDHTSSHLFECKSLPTSLSSLDLWTNPDKVEPFLATWGERLLAATLFGCWTLLAARWWSGVDNNNNKVSAVGVVTSATYSSCPVSKPSSVTQMSSTG